MNFQKETLPVAWKSEGIESFGWFHRVFRLVRTTPHKGGALRESHTEHTLAQTKRSADQEV